ncbi:TPA: hypothetical protein N0F65_009511 [Lagenidium giganteum]|uniref:SsrA-binding protein n=1 Tax=Lagenidium giganteum TaxID=4803 RepID=A0AAV2ZDA9_9STRA|nr:TPA: hypothetical protein N0F65_009511 [Lagenidium giganteum]
MAALLVRRVAVHGVARQTPVQRVGGWPSVLTRGVRNYPIQLLCRNQQFLRKVTSKSYEVEREWNLGIVLQPSEVKSLRARNCDLSAAFAAFYKNELYLHQCHIPVWRQGLLGRPEPMRVRKLLAHRSELKKLEELASEPNAELIPMRVEVGNTGWIKVVVAHCYKRSKIDNRKRDDEREAKRALRDW